MYIKKLDKLIINLFVGRFLLTLLVAFFILTLQFFLIYFNELAGKDLGLAIYTQFLYYTTIIVMPKAFPLALLLTALMLLGALGEHFELVALKSAGISLTRVLAPLVVCVSIISIGVGILNEYLVPKASLHAYSLIHDLIQKRPSLLIQAGSFCHNLPGYSIKVHKKLSDEDFQNIIIYDHTQKWGKMVVTLADTGKLYKTADGMYLVMELFQGRNYIEVLPNTEEQQEETAIPHFYRSSFASQKIVFSLEELQLTRSKKELWAHNPMMCSTHQLQQDIATKKKDKKFIQHQLQRVFQQYIGNLDPRVQMPVMDAKTNRIPSLVELKACIAQAQQKIQNQTQSPVADYPLIDLPYILDNALRGAKQFKRQLKKYKQETASQQASIVRCRLELHSRLALAIACLVMLLVGAPLGAIIRKGGLGIPLLTSTVFIMLYYIGTMFGPKWAVAGLISPFSGAWMANGFLLPFCLFFLRKAHQDASLFESDFYVALVKKMKKMQ